MMHSIAFSTRWVIKTQFVAAMFLSITVLPSFMGAKRYNTSNIAQTRVFDEEVIFLSQLIRKATVDSFLLQPAAHYYIFQNTLKKNRRKRDKYELVVYIYDNNDSLLNKGRKGIFWNDPGNANNHKTEDHINLASFRLTRDSLEALTTSHPTYRFLRFKPESANSIDPTDPNYKEYVKYIIEALDSTYAPLALKEKPLAPFVSSVVMNPSPPARPAD